MSQNNFINLKTQKTAWVFLLPASEDVEDRHLEDLRFGLTKLLELKINHDDIFLFLEVHQSLALNLPTYLNITNFGIQFSNNGTLDDFMNLPNTHFQNYDNTVFFVLGHGSEIGLKLSSNTYLSPYGLVNKIKNNNNIKNSILFVGQCYSGIFNYLKVKNEDENKQQLSIIGATELHMSLSSSVAYNNNPWCGNLFYFYLFNWLGKPFDMDGDGCCSILDAYKYTGSCMNQYIKEFTENCLSKYMSLYTEKTKLENQLLAANKNKRNDLLLNIKLKENEMKNELSFFTIKQDAWVLNANHARTIGF